MERKQEYFEVTSPRLTVEELQSLLTDCDPEGIVVIRVSDKDLCSDAKLRVTQACRIEVVPVPMPGQDKEWWLGTEIVLETGGPVM